MTVYALAPFPLVFATVNGEVLPVVVKCGRLPGIFRVASGAIRRKLELCMVGVGRAVEIICMAPRAVIWRVVVVTVVASRTIVGNRCMCPVQRVITIVVVKTGRVPTWLRRVAGGTIRRKC